MLSIPISQPLKSSLGLEDGIAGNKKAPLLTQDKALVLSSSFKHSLAGFSTVLFKPVAGLHRACPSVSLYKVCR